MTPFTVRQVGWGDFPDLTRIYLALYDEVRENPDLGITLFDKPPTPAESVDWFSGHYRAVLNGESISDVAVADGHVVGTCTVRRQGPSVESRHIGELGIHVARSWRGKGVGRALMGSVIEKSRAKFEMLNLTVFASNLGARKLYETLGFRVWGTLPGAIKRDGKYTDRVHMVLPLGAKR